MPVEFEPKLSDHKPVNWNLLSVEGETLLEPTWPLSRLRSMPMRVQDVPSNPQDLDHAPIEDDAQCGPRTPSPNENDGMGSPRVADNGDNADNDGDNDADDDGDNHEAGNEPISPQPKKPKQKKRKRPSRTLKPNRQMGGGILLHTVQLPDFQVGLPMPI